jgi:hypothetical protein
MSVHVGSDGEVRAADVEYKVSRESKIRVTTRPIHKLVLVVPMEEQTMEDPEAPEDGRERMEDEAEEQSGQGGDDAWDEARTERGEHESNASVALSLPVSDGITGEEDPERLETPNKASTSPRGNLKITCQGAAGDMRDVGQAVKRGRGRPRKGEMHANEDHQETISPGPGKGSLSDREVGRCLEPEGNGVNSGRGNGGGPGPPSGE